MGKSSLAERYNDSYNSRNQGGSNTGILDWSKLEERPKFYKLKEGKNAIDIIPFTIKSSNHPLVKRGVLKVGALDYVLDVWVHKSIGPSETDVVCPKKTYGKPCPVCDQAEEYKSRGQKEEFDAYKAKRRVVYCIRDALKPEDGIQVLEQSHFKFEKELIEEAKNSADGEGIVDFADPESGKTIKFRGSAAVYMGRTSIEPKNFGFVERETPLGKLTKSAISFDELLILHTPEQMLAIMNGVDEDVDEEGKDDVTPTRSRAPKDEGDDNDISPKKDDAEDEPTSGKKPSKEDDDGSKCPYGHKFGKDNDEEPECEDCKQWKACARAAR